MRATDAATNAGSANYTWRVDAQLPDTTIVSIGHRSTLEAFHQRQVSLVRSGEQFTLGDSERPATVA